jgi:hypothetical protein
VTDPVTEPAAEGRPKDLRLESAFGAISDRLMQDIDDAIVRAEQHGELDATVKREAIRSWFGSDGLDAYDEWMAQP